MKRDMELVRKILFKIEKEYIDTALSYDNIKIEGYDMKTIGYHCDLMYNVNLLSYYNPRVYDNELGYFFVGKLTWEGHEYLDKIKNENVWNKTKSTIKEKGLELTMEIIPKVAGKIISEMI
ncbi:DUF2513 domain-containing protein [Miniphocaeibacter massiliensis]|uniref:DUF2513 domain-containing protein n=1 Tax=Miniphocaeibacter massiliensis TaxID=2041841 RepID=UPI000C06B15F|nr:DUF2513 domain-containing protein [Miniphocaeibacter massiliensis]